MDNPRWLDFQAYTDDRGCLVVAEAQRHVPFEIKRLFWIFDVPEGKERGGHAHRNCQQVLVAVRGSVRVRVDSPTAIVEIWTLDDSPGGGLYIPPGITIDLEQFSPDAVLLVLCDQPYDKEDYID